MAFPRKIRAFVVLSDGTDAGNECAGCRRTVVR